MRVLSRPRIPGDCLPPPASRWPGSIAKQRGEAGLVKVLVGAKCLRDSPLFHGGKKPLVSSRTSRAINGRVHFDVGQRTQRLG